MPAIMDWRRDARAFVDKVFDLNFGGVDYKEEVISFFKKKLSSEDALSDIPNLDQPNETMFDGRIVKFKGMVQDMPGSEYYLDKYKVKKEDGSIEDRPGMFRDVPCLKGKETIIEEDDIRLPLTTREKLYIVSIPGLTQWAESIQFGQKADSENIHSFLPEDFIKPSTKTSNVSSRQDQATYPASTDDYKRKHYPVPGAPHVSCIGKFHNLSEYEIEVNKVIEIVGVLSNDPRIGDTHTDMQEDDVAQNETVNGPSAASVPRIHVIKHEEVESLNPLVSNIQEPLDPKETRELRQSVVEIFTTLLLGDALAAEFLLLHLVTSLLPGRGMTVGHLPLNLSGITEELRKTGFVQKLVMFLKHILPAVVDRPLTIHELNTQAYIPSRNAATDRIESGILQLADKSQLILDETQLTEGGLNNNGVKNVQGINKVCKDQMMDMQCPFHSLQFPKELRILTLSENGSFFESCRSTRIHLKPEHLDMESALNKTKTLMEQEEGKIWKIRKYLTQAAFLVCQFDSSITQVIQDEFVEARKPGNSGMSAEELHYLITVTKTMSKSCGDKQITQETWTAAKALIAEKKLRLRNL